MTTIQEITLPTQHLTTLNLPFDATILSVDKRGSRFILSVMGATEQPTEPVTIVQHYTGAEITEQGLVYIGSRIEENLHFFKATVI